MIGISCAATGCTGGLGVRIILAADLSADLGAMLGARIAVAARAASTLPTGRRADFDAFLIVRRGRSWRLFCRFAGRFWWTARRFWLNGCS